MSVLGKNVVRRKESQQIRPAKDHSLAGSKRISCMIAFACVCRYCGHILLVLAKECSMWLLYCTPVHSIRPSKLLGLGEILVSIAVESETKRSVQLNAIRRTTLSANANTMGHCLS
jgi:hypothetical protein